MRFLTSSLAACLALTLTVANPVPAPAELDERNWFPWDPHRGQENQPPQDLAAQELQAINAVGSGLTALNNTLNTFRLNDPVGLFEALKVQLETSQVSNSLISAARTANKSLPFTYDESAQIATAVVNLEPTIFSVLNNIVTHKPAFATAIFFVGDISLTVEHNLIQQRELSRAFSDALAQKLTEPFKGFAPLIAGQIDNAFATAIAAYQSCSGLLCLPPIDFKRRP
jgi:hypothetical protein